MDPITRASRAFLAEADAFWRAGKGPLLPMIAAAPARGDLVKTLRLAELALENRRPLFVHEAPFAAARAWGDALAAAIAEDYQAVRDGAAKEGVTLPPFAAAGGGPSAKDPPLARAVWAIERAAALLAAVTTGDTPVPPVLDGVMVALVPARVEDGRAYRDAIATLAATHFSPRVRLAVHCPPGGPLDGAPFGDGAHFHVDPDELAEHLKQLGAGGESKGPPVAAPPAPTEEQKRAYEAKTGRKLASPEASRTLRALLVEAATASGRGDHEAAASRYREARALCQHERLVLEEAMVLLAIGGACLAAGRLDLASGAYERAGGLATGLEAWPVVCQAWLGAGGAQLTAKRYELAALAYGNAAEAAKRADLAVLGVEALRMAGTCHVLRGVQSEAMRAWLQAVDLGGGIDVAARRASTFPEVVEALSAMLERRGLSAQAAHVRSLLSAPPTPTREEPPASADTLDVPAGTQAPALPFTSQDADDTSTATLPPALSPLRPALPFTAGGSAAPDKTRRS